MLQDLDNLKPAQRIEVPAGWRPAVEFDGSEGTATTNPLGDDEKPDFDKFLADAGFDPAEYEIIGDPRTSRWQVASPWPAEPRWLTSYRFRFRKRGALGIDLPTLYAEAKKKSRIRPVEGLADRAIVILFSDLQAGKVDSRGGVEDLIQRVEETKGRMVALIKKQKPSKVVFCDVGDIIENFTNAADLQQLATNTLSIMEQVDLAATIVWDYLKTIAALVPDITYLSVGSNHCQFRINKQRIGKPVDDWGIHIGRTLARLSKETGLGVKFFEPQPHDESLAHDVFGDGFHILGLWHGHQANRPEGVPEWWRKQAFGNQPVSAATIGVSGHFHHLRVQELGSTPRGSSRFWVQAATLDNGSGWFRLNSGEDSQPGLVTFALEAGVDFAGTVYKL